MIINDKQAKAVRKWLPERADALLQSEDVNDLLEALDDVYLDLLDYNQDPTPESDEVERLRDHIHWDNTH